MKKFSSIAVLLGFLGIFVLASSVRIVNLSNVPPGINRDEAALGYTAYSLLKTGRDEYGIKWPISLKSFGDYKLPVYAYLTIPFIATFGLNEFAVRLPSVLAGIFTVLLTYLIAKELFKKSSIALVASLVLAISPWHIFFSRVASEVNMAVFITAFAFYLFVKADKYLWFLPISSVLLAFTLFTYHGNHVFTPLLLGLLIIYNRKLFFSKIGIFSLVLFIALSAVIYKETLFTADRTKITGLLSINDPAIIHAKIEQNRLIYKNPFWGKIVNNKYIFFVEQFIYSYIRAFSPEFLFIKGGTNKQHNLPDFGNLYPIEIIFIFGGLYLMFKNREKYAPILFWWILLSPIGASLTKDAPHSARQFVIFPAVTLIIAYGIYKIANLFKKRFSYYSFIVTIGLVYIGSLFLFISKYFIVFPYKGYIDWGKGYKELVEKTVKYKKDYKEIFIARPDYSPYIYYLFYEKSDPVAVQKQLKRYPPTDEGFVHVAEFDDIKYQKLDWTDELLTPDRLYIDWVEGIPRGATKSAIIISKTELASLKKKNTDLTGIELGVLIRTKIVDMVLTPDGQPLFYLIGTFLATPSGTSHENLQ